MERLPGALAFHLLLSVALAAAAGWVLAARYRRRMLTLMRACPAPNAYAPPQAFTLTLQPRHAPPTLDLTANRRATWRLLACLAGLSLVIGLSQSALALNFVYETDRALSLKQWGVVGLILAWPLLLGWGLLLHWSWLRLTAGVAGYFVLITPLVMPASDEAQTLGAVFTLYGTYASIPLAIVLIIGASGQVRAVAPYLLPIFLTLLLASQLGWEMLFQATSGDIPAWPVYRLGFAFVNGQLADRFIARAEDIPRRVAELDLHPDPDGRYRVNEFHCYDTTWQPALRALVEHSDVVLMDLRGFKPENQGCRFELRVLAAAPHLQRVVLLQDAGTARDAALAELAGAAADRFVWLDAGRLGSAKTRQVLQALFAAPQTHPRSA